MRKMPKALIIFIFQESKWSFFKRKMKQNTNFENPIYAEVLLNIVSCYFSANALLDVVFAFSG